MTDMATVIGADFEAITIRKDEVVADTNVERLTQQFVALDAQALILSEFLRAYREAEMDDDDYFERTAGKLAFIRIASRWVERRLLALDAHVPYPPTDPRARQLRVLNDKVERMQQRIAALEARGATLENRRD